MYKGREDVITEARKENEQLEKRTVNKRSASVITMTNLERKRLTKIKPRIAISGSEDTPNALHCVPE